MMLEKKTTKSIIKLFDLIPDGTEQNYNSFYDKVWVSQESLINKWFNFRDKIENARILTPETYKLFDEFQKELKGEKE